MPKPVKGSEASIDLKKRQEEQARKEAEQRQKEYEQQKNQGGRTRVGSGEVGKSVATHGEPVGGSKTAKGDTKPSYSGTGTGSGGGSSSGSGASSGDAGKTAKTPTNEHEEQIAEKQQHVKNDLLFGEIDDLSGGGRSGTHTSSSGAVAGGGGKKFTTKGTKLASDPLTYTPAELREQERAMAGLPISNIPAYESLWDKQSRESRGGAIGGKAVSREDFDKQVEAAYQRKAAEKETIAEKKYRAQQRQEDNVREKKEQQEREEANQPWNYDYAAPEANAALQGDGDAWLSEAARNANGGDTVRVYKIKGKRYTEADLRAAGFTDEMITILRGYGTANSIAYRTKATENWFRETVQPTMEEKAHASWSTPEEEQHRLEHGNAILSGQYDKQQSFEVQKSYKQYEREILNGEFGSEEERQAALRKYYQLQEEYYRYLMIDGDDEALDREIRATEKALNRANERADSSARTDDLTAAEQRELARAEQGLPPSDLSAYDSMWEKRSEAITQNGANESTMEETLLAQKLTTLKAIKENNEQVKLIERTKNDGTISLFQELYDLETDAGNYKKGGIAQAVAGLIPQDPLSNALLDKVSYEAEKKVSTLVDTLKGRGYTDEDLTRFNSIMDQQKNKEVAAPYVQFVKSHPVIGPAVAAAGSAVASTFTSPARLLDQATTGGKGFSMAEAIGYATQQGAAAAEKIARDRTGELVGSIAGPNAGKVAAEFAGGAYQFAVSAAESFVDNVVFGKATDVIMGLNAAVSAYDEAITTGIDKTNAVALGILSGISEAVFEHLSLEKVKFFNSTKERGFKGWMVMLLKSSFTNGTEEVFTDIADEFINVLGAGELSNYNMALAQGYTPSQYAGQFALKLVDSFAGGALQGVAFGAAEGMRSGVFGNTVRTVKQDVAAGQSINRVGGRQTLIDAAKESGDRESIKLAEKLEQQISEGKSGDRVAGQLYNRMQTGSLEQAAAQRYKEIAAEQGVEIDDQEAQDAGRGVAVWAQRGNRVDSFSSEALGSEVGKQLVNEVENNADWYAKNRAERKTFARETGALDDKAGRHMRTAEAVEKRAPDVTKAIREGDSYTLVKDGFDGQYVGKDGQRSEAKLGGIDSIGANNDLMVVVDDDGKGGPHATAAFSVGEDAAEGTVQAADRETEFLYLDAQAYLTGNEDMAQPEQYGADYQYKDGATMSVAAANTALATYDSRVNPDAHGYMAWYFDAHKAGKSGVSWERYLSFHNQRGAAEWSDYITEEQLREAFRTGQMEFSPRDGVTRIGNRDLKAGEGAFLQVLDYIAKKLHFAVVAADDIAGKNGFVSSRADVAVISLDADAGRFMTAAFHEIHHLISRELGITAGRQFTTAVLDTYRTVVGKQRFNEDLKHYEKQYKGEFSEEDRAWKVREEMAAQYFGNLAEDHIDLLVKRIDKTGGKQLLTKVVDALKAFRDAISEALQHLAGIDPATRAAAETSARNARKLFDRFIAAAEQTMEARETALAEQGEELRTAAEKGELESRAESGERSAENYSLKAVAPVEPSSDAWERTLTTEEAMRRFPNLWNVAAEESDTRNPTQVKVTVSSYRKIYDILKSEGFNGTILDASSGLGYGTRAGREEYGFDVDDIEPYPGKDYHPKYKDYSALNKKYDVIISNAVLNVLPQDQRDALTVKMGEMLNDGGRLFVNVRGNDVFNASSLEVIDRNKMEVYISKSGSYQKGFTKDELKAYLKDALGDGFTVETTNKFGAVAAVVTKTSVSKKVPKSNSVYSSDQMENVMDSFGLTSIWDYRHIQNRVFETLVNEGFFGKGQKSTTVINVGSGMIVELDKGSIDEAFFKKNFLNFSTPIKIAKLITIRHIKDVIRNGTLTQDNVPNQHGRNSSVKYAYIEYSITIDGYDYHIKADIRKSPQKNKFWVHEVEIKNIKRIPAGVQNNSKTGSLTLDVEDNATTPTPKSQEADSGERETSSRKVTDYDKPITREDIDNLRAMFPERKSVKDFTAAELDATAKWAYKYWQDKNVRTKSPFFRAWFGEWRAKDTTLVKRVSVPTAEITAKDVNRADATNKDTGWQISVTRDGIDETANKEGKWSTSYHSLPEVQRMLENAVLLDSQPAINPSERMGDNAAFVHLLYCPIRTDSQIGFAKLYVVESYDDTKRFYLTKIESEYLDSTDAERHFNSSKYSDNITVANLYALVKQKDKDFVAGREVSPLVLNADGTPKVFYHQTAADFTVFSTDNPVAGKNDSETPNGIFFKDNDHDIGIGGNRQMAVYLSIHRPLHFVNRAQANRWYRDHVDGYDALADEQKAALAPISAKMDEIENEMFADETTSEEYDTLDAQWNELLEEMRVTEDGYSAQMRSLLNEYFLENDSGYDGIVLDDDGHRYVDGKREDVHTTIAFQKTQVKSAETGTERENAGTFSPYEEDIRWSKKVTDARAELAERTLGRDELGQMLDETAKFLQQARKTVDKAEYDAWIQSLKTGGRVPQRTALMKVVRQYNDPKVTGESNEALADRIVERLADMTDEEYSVDALIYTLVNAMYRRAAETEAADTTNEARSVIREVTQGQKYYINDGEFNYLVEHTAGTRRGMNEVFRRVYGFTLYPESEAERRGARSSIGSIPGELQGQRQSWQYEQDVGDGNLWAILGGNYDEDVRDAKDVSVALQLYEMRDDMLPPARTLEDEVRDRMKKEAPDVQTREQWVAETIYEEAYQDAARFAEDIIRLSPMRTLADAYEGTMEELRQAAKGVLAKRAKEIEAIAEKLDAAEAALGRAGDISEEQRKETARLERQVKNLEDQMSLARAAAEKAKAADAKEAAKLQAKADDVAAKLKEAKSELAKERSKVKRRDKQIEAQKHAVREARYAGDWEIGQQKLADDIYYGRKLNATRQYYIQKRHEDTLKRADSASRQKALKKIEGQVRWLRDRFERGTTAQHIPARLRELLKPFIDAFLQEPKKDSGSTTLFTKDMIERLSLFYAGLEDGKNQDGSDKENSDSDPLFGRTQKYITDLLDELRRRLSDKKLNSRNKDERLDAVELDAISKVLANVIKIVREENTLFVDGKRVKYHESGHAWERTIQDAKANGKAANLKKAMGKLRTHNKFQMGMLKPIYFFNKVIGGEAEKYFNDIREAQNRWAFRVQEAAQFFAETTKKYKYFKWRDGMDSFLLDNGSAVVLTKDAVLQLYVTHEREKRSPTPTNHLFGGGMVLSDDLLKLQKKKNLTGDMKGKDYTFVTSLAQSLTLDDLQRMFNTLTDEQKKYAEAVVGYMSSAVAEWGNEASREMLGFDNFTEPYYFPYVVSGSYLSSKVGQQNDIRLKNIGFTHALTQGANKPIVVAGFSDIAAKHVGSMASYSTLALPLDNLQRIRNYRDKDTGETIASLMKEVYGSNDAFSYISTFLEQMNGAVRTDNTVGFLEKGLGWYKRNAVALNLSVVLQQPSAIARAMHIVPRRYFVGRPHLTEYKELKQYSGVAIVKEMGGYDTDTGRATQQYILGDFTASQKISEKTGWLANKADEITWSQIWNAVKRETAKKMGLKYRGHHKMSEEFYQAAAKRFNDVIDYTQVYDSTLSRSQFMRSKNPLAKVLTAFMAEPTTTYNMLMFGNLGEEHKAAATASILLALLGNAVLNRLLKSLVSAWRDWDDEPYWERYIKDTVQGLVGAAGSSKYAWVNSIPLLSQALSSELNPLNDVVGVKDVISMLLGYEVDNMYFSVLGDLFNAAETAYKKIEKMGDDADWKDWVDAIGPVITKLTAFTPIPLQSVFRDTWTWSRNEEQRMRNRGLEELEDYKNLLAEAKDAGSLWKGLQVIADKFGYTGFAQHMKNMLEQTFKGEWDENEKLYYAILQGDKTALEKYTRVTKEDIARYTDEANDEFLAMEQAQDVKNKQYHTKVQEALRQMDDRIEDAARALLANDLTKAQQLADAIAKDGFDIQDVYNAIHKTRNDLKPPEPYDKKEAKDAYLATYDMLQEAYEEGDTDFAAAIRNDMIVNQGKADKDVDSKIAGYVKNEVENGEISYADARKALEDFTTLTAKDIDGKMETYINDAFKAGELTLAEAKKAYEDYTGYSDATIKSKLVTQIGYRYSDYDDMTLEDARKMYEEIGLVDAKIDSKAAGLVVSDYKEGRIADKEEAVRQYITQSGIDDEAEARRQFDYLDFTADFPEIDLSRTDYDAWVTTVEPAGVDFDTFYTFTVETKGMSGDTAEAKHQYFKDNNSKGFGIKQAQVLPVIAKMPISNDQKDEIYKAYGWSEQKLPYTPWHNPGYWAGLLD